MDKQSYIIEPKHKKSLIEKTILSKKIDNVEYFIHQDILWRYGEFILYLNNDEYDKVINYDFSEPFCVNDYDMEFVGSFDGCDCNYYLYDNEENEITEGLLYDKIMKTIEDNFYTLEDSNGWYCDDTIYTIYNGIDIKKEE